MIKYAYVALHIPSKDTSSGSYWFVQTSLSGLSSKSTILDANLNCKIPFNPSIRVLQLALGFLSSHSVNISEKHTSRSADTLLLFIALSAAMSSSPSNSIPKSSHTCDPAAQIYFLTCLLMYFTAGRSSTILRRKNT